MKFFFFFSQAAPVNIIVGSHVWVEDPALAWIDGEVTRVNGQELHVHTTKGKTVSILMFNHTLYQRHQYLFHKIINLFNYRLLQMSQKCSLKTLKLHLEV